MRTAGFARGSRPAGNRPGAVPLVQGRRRRVARLLWSDARNARRPAVARAGDPVRADEGDGEDGAEPGPASGPAVDPPPRAGDPAGRGGVRRRGCVLRSTRPGAAAPARALHAGQARPPGRPVLLAELESSGAFRSAVAAWWAEHRPGSSRRPRPTPSPPRPARCSPATGGREAVRGPRGAGRTWSCAPSDALARVDKLTVELERLRAELGRRAGVGPLGRVRAEAEYQQLRRRVSEQGARLRAALDGRADAERAVEELRAAAAAELAAALAERDRERERADAERGGPPTPPPRSRRRARPRGRPAEAGRGAARAPPRHDRRRAVRAPTGAVARRRWPAARRPRGGGPGRSAGAGGRLRGGVGRAALGAVGAPRRRRLQRHQDRLPGAAAARTSARGWPGSWPRSPAHRGGDHAGFDGAAVSSAARLPRRPGAVQRPRGARRRRDPRAGRQRAEGPAGRASSPRTRRWWGRCAAGCAQRASAVLLARLTRS